MTLFLNEQLLQYIWKFQYFNTTDLTTTAGEPLSILHTGTWNTNQGPDFQNARIRIGDQTWAGTVELHYRTSDWKKHGHTGDQYYRTVILHVVWEHDVVINDIPVLELRERVPGVLLERYGQMMHKSSFIPCEDILRPWPDLLWESWRERLLTERLIRRKLDLDELLNQNRHDWEETTWRLLARNFGMRLNADAFDAMARSIPLKMITRKRHDRFTLEALLMGQAGLLTGRFRDDYPRSLQREYRQLAHKSGLEPAAVPCVFLRMRPANFPGIRLSQLAGVLHQAPRLFSTIRDSNTVKDIRHVMNVTASHYWDSHYRFDEPSSLCVKQVGDMLADNIVVNTAVPLLFTYAHYLQDHALLEKALRWLMEVKPENNHIIHSFQQLNFPVASSADSQALLELKHRYCEQHRCLDCMIGNFLLKQQP